MYCTQCGAKTLENAKFCAGCGAVVAIDSGSASTTDAHSALATAADSSARPTSSAPQVHTAPPPPLAETSDGVAPADFEAQRQPESDPRRYELPDGADHETAWWKKPLPLIAGGILVLGFLLYGLRDFWLGMDPQPAASNSVASVNGATGNSVTPVGNSFYAVRKAKLRDKPSTEGSVVKGEVVRGAQLTGQLVEGTDGKTQWLKVDGTGYFISAANISNEAPVVLSAILNRTVTLDEQSDVRSQPSDDAAPMDSLVSGTAVDAVGVADGWIEITLKKGGVGYIKPSEKSTNFGLLSGKAPIKVTSASLDFDQILKFDPDSCSFGGPLEGLFSAMGANANKAPFSVTGLPGLFKSTSVNPTNPETSTIVTTVTGKYRGVTVTGVFQAYEGQGLYFGDSVEAVGSALAPLGFTKDDKGNWATSDEGVGAYISAEGGKTRLYCGA
jgi:hypothetical protein